MNLELMKQLTTFNVPQLYKVLLKFLRAHGYKNIKKGSTFIMAEGDLPVCLIAHMDTVFHHVQDKENFIYDSEKHILWGIRGSGFDDRAGIYAIIELIQCGYRPHVIFTDGEEVGGIGANDLVTRYTKCPFKCNMLIELDRANEKDAVYYNCDNPEFENYIESFGFITDWGTFSDISIIAPVWKIAAVNLSVGYEWEHTPNELLHTDWLDATIDKVEELLGNVKDSKKYKYIPTKMKYHYMRPLFQTNTTECLICGTKLNKNNTQPIYDEEFPYCVCSSCYAQYYLTDEHPF
jgi:putative aminopeptidase FrvX